ncbi:MAG TPA: ABC transporter substrate-binding protein [Kineosporiaceae bacterium]|nr:ABC transporter substrate-binding protein [Kineosporiaceae bacterium]
MSRRMLFSSIVVGTALAVTACAPPSSSGTSTSASGSASGAAVAAKDAKSATDVGGLDALIAAAKKEGALNVIALPPDWANYGAIIAAFKTKYGITVNSANPEGSSQDEVNAVKQLKGTDRSPDVLDVGLSVALANAALFAPYQVSTWKDIPDAQKEPTGVWFQDYGGYMSIGYDSAKVPAITSVADLLKPAFKDKVALNGDPTQANAALTGVVMASVASGGSLEDVSKGTNFFKQLKAAGNFVPVASSPATIKSGTTPVVFDWDYLNASAVKNVPTWKVFVPPTAVIGGYYVQAINKDAAHPAAARLWEEFLYSDEGQNLYLKGGARPVRMDAMTKAGTIDAAAAAALPKVGGTPTFLSIDQATKAKTYLASNWAKAIG